MDLYIDFCEKKRLVRSEKKFVKQYTLKSNTHFYIVSIVYFNFSAQQICIRIYSIHLR